MKIRTGFVSNSSSSSFCVFGCPVPNNRDATFNHIKKYMTEENFIEMHSWKDEVKPEYKKLYKEIQKFDCYDEASDGLEIEDSKLLDEVISDLSHEILTYVGNCQFYVGLEPSQGRDDETFKEFKERAKKLADDLIGKSHGNLAWECDAYYD